ncbi:phytoene/squalene synthase family protein [Glacieibacterium frigidum]|uniref:Phytoene/squalene synthase family protein n=1 Tax=Glacieibacterium frigidum TaxID=2593303 RepID=A0A552UIT8_9SPHN|nr:phytoene/squalene synthase family protein [Glacieibacterium frigidum]TRW18146.1 phytoene/squalene synthase family protein [Glacieibacterium frigidum]
MDPVVAYAHASIAEGSKSFALASRLFDARTREVATLLYAWCRYCDDVIDGQAAGQGSIDSDATPEERLADLDVLTMRALAGDPGDSPPAQCLARVVAATGMPGQYPMDLIEGFRIDVEQRPFRTFDDTLTYCYHVAGVVGVMMAIVMGVSPTDRATLDRASDLGISFQLNNIARDVIEDALNRRRYIPDEWLASEQLPLDRYAFPPYRRALARLVARLVDEAERYEASAHHGTAALPMRAAWAVLSAARIYGDIGRQVRDGGAPALDARAFTTRGQKLRAVAAALPQALSRGRARPDPSRAGLWTRP